jgi:4'-phosphopantetheinyl transferase
MTGRLILSPWSSSLDSIDSDEIRVLVVPLENSPLPFSDLLQILVEDERARAERFRVEKPRIQFVITRGLLRLALARILGVAPAMVPIGYTAVGKPILLENNTNLHFNVTHTDGLALIAFARRVIGVDVEKLRRMENGDGLVVRFFSELEQFSYLSLDIGRKEEGFFRGWTCKEALIKAAGLSVAYLDTFDVEIDPEKPARLLAVRNPGLMGSDWGLVALKPAVGYAAAVAVPGIQELVLCQL